MTSMGFRILYYQNTAVIFTAFDLQCNSILVEIMSIAKDTLHTATRQCLHISWCRFGNQLLLEFNPVFNDTLL